MPAFSRCQQLFATIAACALLAACSGGGGGSSPAPIQSITGSASPTGGATTPPPNASGSASPTASATAHASSTPGSTATPTSAPTATPSAFSTGAACTAGNASPVPGLYTWVGSYGNVVGNTYTQDNNNFTEQNVYQVWLLYTPPPASPVPTPTGSFAPPSPLPTVTNPPPTITPSPPPPTITPTPQYQEYTTYVGSYSIPSFLVTIDGTQYMTNTSPGCMQMTLIQAPGGKAGMTRRRDVDSFFGDNSTVFGSQPYSAADALQFEYEGAVTSMTITNLTATTGNATFTLDNGVTGTMTVTGSETATLPVAGFAVPRKIQDVGHRILERFGPAPYRR